MIKKECLINKEQQLDIKFEKYNSKYNRIWEQLTSIGIFTLTVVSGYLIAVASIQKNIETLLTIETVNYILLGMAIIMGSACSILITHLVSTRKEISKMLNEYHIA